MAINPIPPLFVLGIGGLGIAASWHAARSRTRSEWLSSFETWAGPASSTEDEKIARTERMVRSAIEKSPYLARYNLSIIPQGSSINNTNIKQTSDLDLVVMNDEPWYLPADGEHLPPSHRSDVRSFDQEYEEFRNAVLRTLSAEFDGFLQSNVASANKCIKVSETASTRVACDVVPSFRLRKFHPSTNALAIPSFDDGIIFRTTSGDQIFNYPKQYLENGRKKNVRTGYRYKQIVRVLKKLKVNLQVGQTILTAEILPSSYEIEALVYSAPDKTLSVLKSPVIKCCG